jgi:hypothetical protein
VCEGGGGHGGVERGRKGREGVCMYVFFPHHFFPQVDPLHWYTS